jgi:hypothetical protein
MILALVCEFESWGMAEGNTPLSGRETALAVKSLPAQDTADVAERGVSLTLTPRPITFKSLAE